MILVNATLQRQINGPLATNKWMRRQQRFSLYAQPVVLLLLVVAFNIVVGVRRSSPLVTCSRWVSRRGFCGARHFRRSTPNG